MITTMAELVARLREYRTQYETSELKINAGSIFTLIMAGVMDELFPTPPTIQERFTAISIIKAALGSNAQIAKGKKGELSLGDIDSELRRKLWLSKMSPVFKFSMCEQFEEALATMKFEPTGQANIKYRNRETDVFASFDSIYSEKALKYLTNKNNPRQVGIVVMYQGYETRTWSRGKMINLNFNDGSTLQQGTSWPKFGTTDDFDAKIVNASKHYRDKVCLVTGKVSVSAKGWRQFTVNDLILLSY